MFDGLDDDVFIRKNQVSPQLTEVSPKTPSKIRSSSSRLSSLKSPSNSVSFSDKLSEYLNISGGPSPSKSTQSPILRKTTSLSSTHRKPFHSSSFHSSRISEEPTVTETYTPKRQPSLSKSLSKSLSSIPFTISVPVLRHLDLSFAS
ncbi:hypothetical protein GEMRC1_006958 [Eukaryota sp. GEM-RC1]